MNRNTLFPGCLLLAALCGWSPPSQAATIRHTLQLDASAVQLNSLTGDDGEDYTVIDSPGGMQCAEPGSPAIPVVSLRFEVPLYSNNYSARTVGYTGQIRTLDCRLYPVQEDIPTNFSYIPAFRVPQNEIYSTCGLEPALTVCDEQLVNGSHHTVCVQVPVAGYNDRDKALQVYEEVLIELDYDNCSPSQTNLLTAHVKDTSTPLPEGMTVNRLPQAERQLPPIFTRHLGQYIIVAPRSLCDALRPLEVWKNQKGYLTQIKAIEDIVADPQYAPTGEAGNEDEGASLRNWLRDKYNSRQGQGECFCLLVGDYRTPIPLRYAVNPAKSLSYDILKNTPYYVPTDSYFANVNQDWHLTWDLYNECYVIPKSCNWYAPEIRMGRLLCTTTEEIENYLYKLFLYETNPGRGATEYLNKAFAFEQDASKEVGSLVGKGDLTMKVLAEKFDTVTFSDRRIIDNVEVCYTGKEILSQINESGFHSWYGHGTPTSTAVSAPGKIYGSKWNLITAREEYLDKDLTGGEDKGNLRKKPEDGLNTLTNYNSPSIAYSISCDNAPLDVFMDYDTKKKVITRVFDQSYNMASSFTVGGPYGGPIFLGNTRFGILPGSNYLEEKFALNLIQAIKSVGVIEDQSKLDYTGSYSNYLRFTHYLCGDPELNIWLGAPETLQTNTKIFPQYLLVSTEGYQYISGFDGKGNNSVVQVSNVGNTATLTPFSQNSPFCAYSLWGHNVLPKVSLWSLPGLENEGEKHFILRDVHLGCLPPTTEEKTILGEKCALDIKAIDTAVVGEHLIMNAGSSLSLDCDGEVELSHTMESGSSATITGKTVRINSGTTIRKGAVLTVKSNRQ